MVKTTTLADEELWGGAGWPHDLDVGGAERQDVALVAGEQAPGSGLRAHARLGPSQVRLPEIPVAPAGEVPQACCLPRSRPMAHHAQLSWTAADNGAWLLGKYSLKLWLMFLSV
jgi:hypothetical protein